MAANVSDTHETDFGVPRKAAYPATCKQEEKWLFAENFRAPHQVPSDLEYMRQFGHLIWDYETDSMIDGYGQMHPTEGKGNQPQELTKKFNPSLGGNVPQEQFTVVIQTYKREQALTAALQRLKGLAFLNKVLVVWNDPEPPSSQLHWPDVGVPLEVLKMKYNSINNRYLPFDSIETEAVLNLDDDMDIGQGDLLFGFKVWREERDRIVGFFNRFHKWDSKNHRWTYEWGRAHELSLVLPTNSFIHKYYLYLYSYVMPQAIRDHVDSKMNCEDIAMSFVVSHVTRKPPLKVKSKSKSNCPQCGPGISNRPGHLNKRHECMNYFASVYGYMPLLFSQSALEPI